MATTEIIDLAVRVLDDQAEVSIDNLKARLEELKIEASGIDLGTDDGRRRFNELETQIQDTGNALSGLQRNFRETQSAVDFFAESALRAFRIVGFRILAAFALRAAGEFFAEITKFTSELEEGFARVNTVAQLSRDSLQQLRNDVIAIGAETAGALDQIPDALFNIVSGLGDVELSVEVLEASLLATEAGFGDLNNTAQAGVNILNAVGRELEGGIVRVFDVLFATQRDGVLTFDDLSRVLPNVIPAARSVGFAFEETSAALAALTKQGLEVNQASTALRSFFTSLTQAGEFERFNELLEVNLGRGVFDAAGNVRALTDVIIDFQSIIASAANEEEVNQIFAGIQFDQNAQKALSALGQGYQDLFDITNSLNDAQGELQTQYDLSANGARDLQEANNGLREELDKIGQAVNPVLTEAKIALLNVVTDLVSAFNDFRESTDPVVVAIRRLTAVISVLVGSAVIGALIASLVAAARSVLSFVAATQAGAAATGAFARALALTRLALLGNPYTAAVVALGAFVALLVRARREQRELNREFTIANQTAELYEESQRQVADAVKGSVDEFRGLIAQLNLTNAADERRQELIDEINKRYGTRLKNIQDETEFLKQNAEALAEVTRQLTAQAVVAASRDRLQQLVQQQLDVQDSLVELATDIGETLISVNGRIVGAVSEENLKLLDAIGVDQEQLQRSADGTIKITEEYFKRLQTAVEEGAANLPEDIFSIDRVLEEVNESNRQRLLQEAEETGDLLGTALDLSLANQRGRLTDGINEIEAIQNEIDRLTARITEASLQLVDAVIIPDGDSGSSNTNPLLERLDRDLEELIDRYEQSRARILSENELLIERLEAQAAQEIDGLNNLLIGETDLEEVRRIQGEILKIREDLNDRIAQENARTAEDIGRSFTQQVTSLLELSDQIDSLEPSFLGTQFEEDFLDLQKSLNDFYQKSVVDKNNAEKDALEDSRKAADEANKLFEEATKTLDGLQRQILDARIEAAKLFDAESFDINTAEAAVLARLSDEFIRGRQEAIENLVTAQQITPAEAEEIYRQAFFLDGFAEVFDLREEVLSDALDRELEINQIRFLESEQTSQDEIDLLNADLNARRRYVQDLEQLIANIQVEFPGIPIPPVLQQFLENARIALAKFEAETETSIQRIQERVGGIFQKRQLDEQERQFIEFLDNIERLAQQLATTIGNFTEASFNRQIAEVNRQIDRTEDRIDQLNAREQDAQLRLQNSNALTRNAIEEELALIEAQREAEEDTLDALQEREEEYKERQFEAEKRLALTRIAIETAIGVARLAAQGNFVAIPFLVALGASQAAVVQSQNFQYAMGGLVQDYIEKYHNGGKILKGLNLSNDPMKYSSGGRIKDGVQRGPSHQNGGIPFRVAGERRVREMEGGEFVVSKKSTSMFLPIIEYLNDFGNRLSSSSMPPKALMAPSLPRFKYQVGDLVRGSQEATLVANNEALEEELKGLRADVRSLASSIRDQRVLLDINQARDEIDRQIAIENRLNA